MTAAWQDIWTEARSANWVLVLASLRIVSDSLETLWTRSEYCFGGTASWTFVRTLRPWTSKGPLAKALTLILDYPQYVAVIVIQLFCALALLFVEQPQSRLFLLVVILIIRLLSNVRSGGLSLNGSDQMQVMLLVFLIVFYASAGTPARIAAFWFIVFQLILAYVTAGVVKLQSPAWRQGIAVKSVLNTAQYGNKTISSLMVKIPFLSKLLCWSVILFECSFPFLIFAGPEACLVFIVCGTIFHFMIAVNMGLNGFFWTFVATYPAVLRFSIEFRGLIASR